MQTQFKDVAHLYLGCEVLVWKDCSPLKFEGVSDVGFWLNSEYYQWNSKIANQAKAILRPLSDIMKEEAKYLGLDDLQTILEFNSIYKGRYTPQQFIYLLKQGFDLFGLTESGQAINKLELK